MLLRTDPFRDLDRLTQQVFGTQGTLARPAVMPMDAWRDGDSFVVERVAASYDAGVLTLRLPVAEQAKPRKITITRDASRDRQAIHAQPPKVVPSMADIIRNAAAGPAEATFADPIIADEEWLRAEFEAIVAAEEWGEPASPRSSTPMTGHSQEPDGRTVPGDPGAVQPGAPTTRHEPSAAERSLPRDR